MMQKAKEIPVQKGSIVGDTLTIGGYKFFYFPGAKVFLQCATCLMQPALEPDGPMILGEVRKLKLIKYCNCPKQK
jgi:hypothetical protein